VQLHDRAHQRHHDLDGRCPARAAPLGGRLGDRPHLHRVQTRHEQPEAHAAQPQHRVGLVQPLHRGEQSLGLRVGFPPRLGHRDLDGQLRAVGQELVQRRVEQPDRDRQSVHRGEQRDEVGPLQRQQLRERRLPLGGVLGQHQPFDQHAALAQEHVLGAAQPDALCAHVPRAGGVLGGVGIGAHAE
jgi:hypothetical protein